MLGYPLLIMYLLDVIVCCFNFIFVEITFDIPVFLIITGGHILYLGRLYTAL
jgi:hypothetical protein